MSNSDWAVIYLGILVTLITSIALTITGDTTLAKQNGELKARIILLEQQVKNHECVE